MLDRPEARQATDGLGPGQPDQQKHLKQVHSQNQLHILGIQISNEHTFLIES